MHNLIKNRDAVATYSFRSVASQSFIGKGGDDELSENNLGGLFMKYLSLRILRYHGTSWSIDNSYSEVEKV